MCAPRRHGVPVAGVTRSGRMRAWPRIPEQREHDVVVYGATGFVGKLTAAYLAEHAPAGRADRARRPLAGEARANARRDRRPRRRLAARRRRQLRRGRRRRARRLDARRRDDGRPVREVRHAAARRVRGRGHALRRPDRRDPLHAPRDRRAPRDARRPAARGSSTPAASTRSRPTSACSRCTGTRATTASATSATRRYVVVGMKGGASGGTVDSLRGQIDEAKRDPRCGGSRPTRTRSARTARRSRTSATSVTRWASVHEPEIGGYMAPFLMGPLNTRVVRRSNALQDYAYGRAVPLPRADAGRRAAVGPGRRRRGRRRARGALRRDVVRADAQAARPAAARPGRGPEREDARERATSRSPSTRSRAAARTSSATSRRSGDPGYKATGVMLGEAALALALDGDRLPDAAGVLTPGDGDGRGPDRPPARRRPDLRRSLRA